MKTKQIRRFKKSAATSLTIGTLCMAAVSLASCKDDQSGAQSETNIVEEEDSTWVYGSCYNHKLTHYAAVQPTGDTGGNIEYWYCDNCCNYYKDATGTVSVITPFLRSHNRAIGPELLKKISWCLCMERSVRN